jgi:hypothetical protein
MNVKQLRDILEGFDDDTIVRFSYDNDDYWHHLVAHEVEFVDLQPVKESSYVQDMIINEDVNNTGEFSEDDVYAVVLS